MSQICQICNHPDRLKIDRDIVSGKSKASISKEYGVSYNAVTNHAANHLSRQLVQAHERKDLLESILNMERLERSFTMVEEIMMRNFKEGRDMIALAANREVRGFFELLCRISDTLLEVRRLELEQARSLEETNPRLHKILMYDKIKDKDLTNLEIAVLGKFGCLADDVEVPQAFQDVIDKHNKPQPTPLPPPEIHHKTDFKPAKTDVLSEPHIIPCPEPDEPEPEPLPPRPVRLIHCSSKSEQRRFVNELKGCKVKIWKGE